MREAAAFAQDSLARLVLFSILGFDYPSAGEVAETRARLRELRADTTATEVAATAAAGPSAAADSSGVKPQSQQLLQDQADSTGKLAVIVASPTQASSSFSHASASFGALGSAPGSAELVHNPRPIAPASRASTYEVSLLLFDLVGFTSLSADVGPSRIVELLDDMYASFDRIVAHRGVRKIETIGDAFLVACGAPEPVDLVVSSATIAKCAIDMLGAVQSFSHRFGPRLKGHKLQARIGIHCGRVLAGVIGAQLPRFQLFGAAVDDVQAMESSSEAGRVHASPEILRHLLSTVSPAVEDSRARSHLRAEALAQQAASSRFGCCSRALDVGSAGGSALSPQRPTLPEAQLLPSPTTRRLAGAEVAPESAPTPEGAVGAHPAALMRRAVPDIKVARSFPDGSAFIERDRATGLAMGIQW
jgi:hypothetical protein